jgi:hypothetical protein
MLKRQAGHDVPYNRLEKGVATMAQSCGCAGSNSHANPPSVLYVEDRATNI